jgi:hypothetical protein
MEHATLIISLLGLAVLAAVGLARARARSS